MSEPFPLPKRVLVTLLQVRASQFLLHQNQVMLKHRLLPALKVWGVT